MPHAIVTIIQVVVQYLGHHPGDTNVVVVTSSCGRAVEVHLDVVTIAIMVAQDARQESVVQETARDTKKLIECAMPSISNFSIVSIFISSR